MSRELSIERHDLSGEELYGRVWLNGQIWNTVTKVWEDKLTDNPTQWKVGMTEDNGVWHGDFPTDLPQGTYLIRFYVQSDAAGDPAIVDENIDPSREIVWDGSKKVDFFDLDAQASQGFPDDPSLLSYQRSQAGVSEQLHVRLKRDGQIWNDNTKAFEVWSDVNIGDYAITLSELENSGMHRGSFPSEITEARSYYAGYFLGTGTLGDQALDVQQLFWDGDKLIDAWDLHQIQLQAIGGGGGPNVSSPVEQESVPKSRTFDLVRKTDATDVLSGQDCIHMRVGEDPLIAWDFKEDLPPGGRLHDITSINVVDGSTAGLSIAPIGIDRGQAKARVEAKAAGKYITEAVVIVANTNSTLIGEGEFTISERS